METIEPILAAQPFCRGLNPHHLKELAACSSRVNFNAGEFLCHTGEEARQFFLILQGRVTVEIFSARRGPQTLQTMGEGDALGWLWFEDKPYHWHLDARVDVLTRVISLEVDCLRRKCEADHDLGYELLKRYAHSLAVRFRVSALQLTDMFQA